MFFKCAFAAVLLVQACYALESRITDGENARPGQFPYQVSLEWGIPPLIKYRHICGGSIIGKQHVLTAAHCIMRLGKLRVVAGKHYLLKHEGVEQVSQVSKRYVHAKYPGGVAPYDIALLKLKTPLVFNDRVAPVRLPEQDAHFLGLTTLTGWGSISKSLLPKLPSELQVADVFLLENSKCYELLNSIETSLGKKPELFDTQVCTVSDSTISACSGDSGGPLVQYRSGEPVQVGIVSWGFMPCGASGMPSVYTRVASYANWVNEKLLDDWLGEE